MTNETKPHLSPFRRLQETTLVRSFDRVKIPGLFGRQELSHFAHRVSRENVDRPNGIPSASLGVMPEPAPGAGLPKNVLLTASLIYLAIPCLIFFGGWLRWPLALLASAAAVLPFLFLFREKDGKQTDVSPQGGISGVQIALAVVIGVSVAALFGVGGCFFQTADWEKHNAILHDLTALPWPVRYSVEGREFPLVYYIGGYLPAALAGKWLGWNAVNPVHGVWVGMGVAIAVLWFFAWTKKGIIRAAAFLLGFSGLDIAGYVLLGPLSVMFLGVPNPLENMEYWSIAWQYSSHASILAWTPQIGAASWVSAAVLFYILGENNKRSNLLWLMGLTLLWSPFITIVVAWILAADFLMRKESIRERIWSYLSYSNACGAVQCVVIGLYFLAKFFPSLPAEFSGSINAGWIFSYAEDMETLIMLVVLFFIFCLLEFGILAILVWKLRPQWEGSQRTIFLAVCAGLILLPLYRYGFYNDLLIKTQQPLLFLLAVFTAQGILSATDPSRKRIRRALIAVFLIGAVTPMIVTSLHLLHSTEFWKTEFPVEISRAEGILDLRERYKHEGSGEWETIMEEHGEYFDSFLTQYIGSPESPFFRFLAPEASLASK